MEIASRAQLRMSFLRYALFTVPLVLLLGIVSGRIADSGYGNPWFEALAKPDIMPPGWVFGAAWTILYILIGFALAIILHARGARGRPLAVSIFVAQLLLNYSWSPVFFAFHQVDTAFLIILGMIALSVLCAILFARIRTSAALLMIPYIAWLSFAALLTFQISQLNPDADRVAPVGTSADIAI
jgi:translocator protein